MNEPPTRVAIVRLHFCYCFGVGFRVGDGTEKKPNIVFILVDNFINHPN